MDPSDEVKPEPKIISEADDSVIRLLAFGDMMFDRGVRKRMATGTEPFLHFNEFIGTTSLDIITANLEGPIIETERTNCQQKPYSFQFPMNMAAEFKKLGFNFLSLANNHSSDCYNAGLLSTRAALDEQGIFYAGGGSDLEKSYAVVQAKDKKVAFVAIDITIESIPIASFYPLIKRLQDENEYVIVQIHWGEEYNLKFTSRQQKVGRELLDSGADIVLGHHPHVVEPIEVYKGKLIFYSFGNFIFDQIGVEENKGLAVKLKLDNSSTTNIELLPFHIINSVPTLFSMQEKEIFCADYISRSQVAHFVAKGCHLSTE
jgi:poly-gamma-glutamate synthesis protein (capsule biosynthesis protein)